MKAFRSIPALALLAVALVAGAARSGEERTAEDIRQMIATAKTAADHEEIAFWYDEQAALAEANAKNHEGLARAYEGSPMFAPVPGDPEAPGKERAKAHCENLTKSYTGAAAEYRMLATAHREAAKKAK